jgi:hypothetical protein
VRAAVPIAERRAPFAPIIAAEYPTVAGVLPAFPVAVSFVVSSPVDFADHPPLFAAVAVALIYPADASLLLVAAIPALFCELP